MALRFGTDGLRGVAGSELTPELTLALGRVAARELAVPGKPFLVGRDTRRSGPLLLAALAAGLAAEGVDVVDVGVLPTPGVAALAALEGAPAAVISASHNPFPDNGIKLFAAGGMKLGDEVEARVEAELVEAELPASATPLPDGASGRPAEGSTAPLTPARAAPLAPARAAPAGRATGTEAAPVEPKVGSARPKVRSARPKVGSAIGRMTTDPDGRRRYEEQLLRSLEGRRLNGLRVALDLGHGAATATAAEVIRASGAELVAVLGDAPDGTNINAGCGSTDPSALAAAVVSRQADAGLAFDGDADRVIAVDAIGQIVDGDRLIALCALDLRRRGRLAGETVVVTVMTNLGFHLAMAERGIAVHQTPVGDRYVLEALDRGGWSLGGEQSGHVIFRDLATTGDGLLSGLQVLDVMARSGRTLADLAGSAMDRLPQVLRNVKVADRSALEHAVAVWDEVRAVEAELGSEGRVLLRPSGTEPLVRVMVEARTEASATAAADRLVAAVVAALGEGDRTAT